MIQTDIKRSVQIISSLFWLTFLIHTDSYFAAYLIIGLLGCLCGYCNSREQLTLNKEEKILTLILSSIFSLVVMIVNYSCFNYLAYSGYPETTLFYIMYKGFIYGCFFIGGLSLAWNILLYMTVKLENIKWCVQIITGLFWLIFLTDTDSYYVAYLLIGFLGCLCGYFNWKKQPVLDKKERILTFIFSSIFALAVIAANYSCFNYPAYSGYPRTAFFYISYKGFTYGCFFIGGLSLAWNILSYMTAKLRNFSWKKREYSLNIGKVFLVPFILISVINILLLFCNYPGILTNDSFNQVNQILNGKYSNHHPFYHTMTIKIFITIGLQLFNDINAAVALYHIFQIFFMAGCFSFVAVTLYQMKISLKWITFCMLWYMLMPFHIIYSFTMWKDIMFGGMVLIFLLAVFRILMKIGKKKWFNIIMLILGCMGMGLFRSNGWFAYFITVVFSCILFWKRQRKLCCIMLGILVVTFILKNPVLDYLQVTQPDTIEALSIPAQQIARVIYEGGELTDDQRLILEQVVDVDAIPATYKSYISDPIKSLVRAGNQNYITEHKGEMIRLYIDLGLSYPREYVMAWIDQTCGYWNGGYEYWHWVVNIGNNTVGVYETKNFPEIFRLFKDYLWVFENVDILRIFLCIGLYTWSMLAILYIAIIRRDRTAILLSIPNLAIILSLLVATPVFSEFRYAYSVLCCMPFLIFMAFHREEKAS